MSHDLCPFCRENNLLRGEVLHDTDDLWYFVAFAEGAIQNAGMAITRRHIETPFGLDKQEWARLHDLLPTFKGLLDTDSPQGYNIGWNVYPTGGQHVEHAHLHIVARYDDEPLAGKGIRYALKKDSNSRP
jgi:diadenosine tetraphosphate (Ap4A) HIT family hydrolase